MKKCSLFQYFSYYGPDFTLDVNPGNRKDYNTVKRLNVIFGAVESNTTIFNYL